MFFVLIQFYVYLKFSLRPLCSVQFSHSVMSYSLQPHGLQSRQAFLSITSSRSLLKPMSIELVMPSNHLILCHPFLLPLSIFPNIRVFSNESALHMRWPKYWSFSISPFNMAQNHFPVSTHISAYMCRACKTWKVLKIKKSRFHLFSRTSSIIDSGFLC